MPGPITDIQTRVAVALALHAKGDKSDAARVLEGVAKGLRFEARYDAMAGTVDAYQGTGLQRFCGDCGRGIVVIAPAGMSRTAAFRPDRRYCSNKCRQAAYRKRRPPKPPKLPKVILL